MAGICWRLLAVFLLVSVASIFVAPAFLHGQNAAEEGSGDRSAVLATVSAPSPTASRHSPSVAPIWIPPPGVLNRDPGAHGSAGLRRTSFSQLVRSAGIIFSGRVTSVGRAPSSPGQRRASTTVTFEVERALRGASPGQSLTIHEWAGLWSGGERYRVGEHVLLFLFSPSKLGLTSPVAGTLGRFAVDSEGRIMMSAQQAAALAADPVLGVETAGITGGKTVVPYAVFIQAVRRSGGEE
jgi:hypothetical protein